VRNNQAKALPYRVVGIRRDGTCLPILRRLTWEMAVRFREELSDGVGEFVRFTIEPEMLVVIGPNDGG